MKKIRYQTKFLIYHTTVLFVIISSVVIYFYHVVTHDIHQKNEQDFRIIVEKTAEQMDSLFYEMDLVALQIAANPSIVQTFQTVPKDNTNNYFSIYPTTQAYLRKVLQSYNFKNDSFSRICLYNNYKDFICTSNRIVTENGISTFFISKYFSNVQEFFKSTSNFVYFDNLTHDILSDKNNSNDGYFVVVREIKDYYSNSFQCGYVEVQQSVNRFYQILENLGQDMSVEIYDNSNNLIYNIDNKGGEEFLYKATVPLKNAPYIINFSKTAFEYQQSVKQFAIMLAIVLILLFFASIALEKALINYLTKPLVKLNRSMKSITMDNLHIDIIEDDSIDIFIKLEDSFNVMLSKLNNSMEQKIIAQTNLVKSQFFALQSQMNPHFLHNMLAIISIEAQIDGNDKIPYICQNLGGILRYNAEMGNGYGTIKTEINSVKEYMELMKIRYENFFEYHINIQQNAENIVVPKLILQPLCENCFKHGFKNVEPNWNIKINAWIENEKWFLKISDNGSGFTKDFLEKFSNEIVTKINTQEVLQNIKIGGLCLQNIYARMLIEYRDYMVFQLYNENNGAVVLLGGNIK